MSFWIIKRTETFLKTLKKHKSNHQFFKELDDKIKRLKVDPTIIGGNLCGSLHGKKSTRLTGKFRLIFQIDQDYKTVYLISIDHRKSIYE